MAFPVAVDMINEIEDIVDDFIDLIEELDEKNEALKKELFNIFHSKDQTPAALLFYTLLSDQQGNSLGKLNENSNNIIISTMQQLLTQLNQLKSYYKGIEHMDFMTLRRHIETCFTSIPTIDKFLYKYDILYKQWIKNRVSIFSHDRLSGGAADACHFCPICNSDLRMIADMSNKSSENKSGVSNKSVKHSLRNVQSKSKSSTVKSIVDRNNQRISSIKEKYLNESNFNSQQIFLSQEAIDLIKSQQQELILKQNDEKGSDANDFLNDHPNALINNVSFMIAEDLAPPPPIRTDLDDVDEGNRDDLNDEDFEDINASKSDEPIGQHDSIVSIITLDSPPKIRHKSIFAT